MAGAAAPAATAAQTSQLPKGFATDQQTDVFVEGPQAGKPHSGKVLAAIQPHCDDIPIFAGGTVCKLIDEGFTGYLIRCSNDEMAGRGASVGEVVLNNEVDTGEVGRRMGLKKTYHLGYRNHLMDNASLLEFRSRLIFLFRLLRVDTVVCYDPWGHYEENPDHYVTAKMVEAACWMSGGRLDYPEHFDAGLEPKSVTEKYYFSRGPQLVNRVVDISKYMDQKVHVNVANVTQGPAGETGSRLRRQLAEQGKKLPLLGDDDDTANRQYIKHLVFHEDAELGKQYGVEYAEKFHYIGPGDTYVSEYVEQNTVDL